MNNLISISLLLCSKKGSVIKIIRDDFDINQCLSEDKSFFYLFDVESFTKAKTFFNTIIFHNIAFDWELNLNLNETLTTLNFAGWKVEEGIFILASMTPDYKEYLYNVLIENNGNKYNSSNCIYDELTQVNNELVNKKRELAKKNAELEKLNNLKNTFLSIAAHDLRSPLSSIIGFSEFLIEETCDILSKDHLEYISIINTSSNFMLGLINNLLDISKIESGKLELDLTKTNISLLIKKNIKVNNISAKKKNIEIFFIDDNNSLEILIDKDKIEQVLNNLISNAIKFSMKNTIIEISLKSTPEEVIITVKDHGQGIPKNELEKLFKPFEKTSVKSTDGEKTTGLGLLIVKKIVEKHNGKVWLESIVGEGSSFFVSLPII